MCAWCLSIEVKEDMSFLWNWSLGVGNWTLLDFGPQEEQPELLTPEIPPCSVACRGLTSVSSMSSQRLGGLWASPSELCPVTPPSQAGVALGLQLSAAWECREVHRAPGQFWAYPLPPKSFVPQSWNWPFLEAFFLVSFCGWVTGSHCLAWGTCADQASLQLVVRFVSDSDCWFYRQVFACSEHCL